MKDDRDKLTLRLHPSLHLKMKVAAKDSGRSVNEEIAWRLRRSVEGYKQ